MSLKMRPAVQREDLRGYLASLLDQDLNGIVDSMDLFQLSKHWWLKGVNFPHLREPFERFDIGQKGDISSKDLHEFLSHWHDDTYPVR